MVEPAASTDVLPADSRRRVAASPWRFLARAAATAALFTNSCGTDDPERCGAACASGTAWSGEIQVASAESELALTACLAGNCVSATFPLGEGTLEAPCRFTRAESGPWQLNGCLFEMLEPDASTGRVLMNIELFVVDANAAGLKDGDVASLVVTSRDGTIVHQETHTAKYRSSSVCGHTCLFDIASRGDAG